MVVSLTSVVTFQQDTYYLGLSNHVYNINKSIPTLLISKLYHHIYSGKTTWHITPTNLDLIPGEPANLHQGQNLLVNAAIRVWDLMYVSKKPALEEVFKSSFGQGTIHILRNHL